MKASELMVGDWVVYNGDTEYINPIKVEGMDIAVDSLITSDREDVGFEGVWPIPLTPEILKKNGFVLKPDGWLWCKEEGNEEQNYIFIQLRKGCDEIRICELNFVGKVNAIFRQIHNVHELQHALRLCGINKEIEL